MGLNPGVGYTGSNLGSAYGFSIDQSVDWLSRNLGRQFECTLSGDQVGGESEYYLQVRKGLVEFDYYGTDDKGIIDIDNLGGFNATNTQNMFFYMNKFNVFETGKRVEGANNETSDFISDGYIILDKEKNYFVFIYKTTPDWQPEGSLYEARAPQIGVAADDSEANLFIKTQRSGGGFLQSYLKSEPKTLQIPVITEEGVIGTFDNAESSCDLVDIGGYSPHAVFGDYLISVYGESEAKDVSGQLEDKGTGFVVTDCYRQDIAYIKWSEELNRFQIYQMQYGPIKLRQNPLGSFKTKLLTAEEEAEWDAGFDLCEFITGSFSGYTKDLNQSTAITQPPVYAGSANIGNYQSPKETL
jgi:hypothetical protein